MGGKFRQSKKLVEIISPLLNENVTYVEPFCGAMGVASKIEHKHMILSDVSKPLINMWVKFSDLNFELPDVVTEKEYNDVKEIRDDDDWKTAYYGYGLSFGGKWFGGFMRDRSLKRNFSLETKKATQKKREMLFNGNKPRIFCSEYYDLKIPPNSLIYCDPPYKGRTKGHNFKDFDHIEFWNWCREMVKCGHVVVVTEFTTPKDFVVIHNFGDTVVRHFNSNGCDGTSEVVVCHETQKELFNI